MRDPVEHVDEHLLADGRRADEPRRARLRSAFAPVEGAHHLRDGSGRGPHGGIDLHAASVPRGREPQERNLDVHQLAGRRGDGGHGDLRHDAVHQAAVATLCIGQAASMGSLLLCAGAKGMRFALPNARIMVHQPSAASRARPPTSSATPRTSSR